MLPSNIKNGYQWAAGTAVIFLGQWAWEVIHGPAYVETTGPVLWRVGHCLPMAAMDTVWSLVLILAARCVAARAPRSIGYTLVAGAGALSAMLVEWRALHDARWTYAPAMPVIPIIHVGLSPILQMTIIPVVGFWFITRPRTRSAINGR